MEWTAEQQAAISHSGRNILVAAAAGSGKTAVLVERIIEKIIQGGLSIDRLLVLTFTEAAAAEMKRKIADAIETERRSALQREDHALAGRLREQSLLVGSAHISTVHAFCSEMLRSHIHLTDLPMDFKIVEEIENEVLRRQALDTVLEQYYARIEKKDGFRTLVFGYGGSKNDLSLRETILRLHSFTRSLAAPNQWLKQATDAYARAAQNGSLAGSMWESALLQRYRQGFLRIEALFQAQLEAANTLEQLDAAHKFPEKVRTDWGNFQACFSKDCQNLNEIRDSLQGFSFTRLTGAKKTAAGDVLAQQEEIKALRAGLKAVYTDLLHLFDTDFAEEAHRIARLYPVVETLKRLVRLTEKRHRALKREKSLLDFSDLEHEFLHLLQGRGGRPSEVAQQLQQQFAEILVDEYQDTNDIQDAMFRLIAGPHENRFMVGDLKQSIYSFRNASPRLFAEKYDAYGEDGISGDGERIRLRKNFRSRSEVIETVNHIFRSILRKETGDLDYTAEEALTLGAAYPAPVQKDAYATEVLLTAADPSAYRQDGAFASYTAAELEAETVAKRIHNMVQGQELLVYDKQADAMRPVRYGDIVILMRSQRSAAPVFERALEARGIPVYTDAGHGYLDSVEVLTVLSFLQIIDNPLQDIPLLAVLRSPMFAFTAEQLAEIRAACPKGSFYQALCSAAERDPDRPEKFYSAQAAAFLSDLQSLRDASAYLGIDELIWKICTEYHYFALAGAMEGGSLRQANLQLLFERAGAFERSTLSGLFQFMNYIETIRESGKDLVPAKAFSERDDVVRILTIHASKGLEYPVVILADTARQFNATDNNQPILWHAQGGIGLPYVDTERRIQYPCLARTLVADSKLHDLKAEEMRLLYVALTRAKEKVLISATYGGRENRWTAAVYEADGRPSLESILAARRYRDWVLPVLLTHPDAGALRAAGEVQQVRLSRDAAYPLRVHVVNHETQPLAEISSAPAQQPEAAQQPKADTGIAQRLAWQYPHAALRQVPVKMSVTELKRRMTAEETPAARLPSVADHRFRRMDEISSTERGTVTHFVLQHMALAETDSPEAVKRQMDDMLAQGMLNQAQYDAVDQMSLWHFFDSPVGRRLCTAQTVLREFDFYMEVAAGMVYPELSGPDAAEHILVQGIADCIFTDDRGTVLLDYKTDRVPAAQAEARAQRYQQQIALYTEGLNAVLIPQHISERYIYFLDCGCAVAM